MFAKIKGFVLDLDYLVGNTFFYSQSRSFEIMKDNFFAKIKRLKNDFNAESGSVRISFAKNEEALSTCNRSNSDFAQFSSGYVTEKIPQEFAEIISKHKVSIEDYLGKGFLFEKPLIFRNYNFDHSFRCYDIYSNVWHQDSHDGNRLLKIFVLLHHTSEEHGPFHYLNFKDVKRHWAKLKRRWSFESMKTVPTFDEQVKITGEAGDYTLLDTSRCSHRASIPHDKRDMMQITLYPNWRKEKGRQPYF